MNKKLIDVCRKAMESSTKVRYINRYTTGFISVLKHCNVQITDIQLKRLRDRVESFLRSGSPAIKDLVDERKVLLPESVLGIFFWVMAQELTALPPYRDYTITSASKKQPLEVLVPQLIRNLHKATKALHDVRNVERFVESVYVLYQEGLSECVDPRVFKHWKDDRIAPWKINVEEEYRRYWGVVDNYQRDISVIGNRIEEGKARVKRQRQNNRGEKVLWCRNFVKEHDLDLGEGDIVDLTRLYLYSCMVWRSIAGQPGEDLRSEALSSEILWERKDGGGGYFYGYVYSPHNPEISPTAVGVDEIYAPMNKVRDIYKNVLNSEM